MTLGMQILGEAAGRCILLLEEAQCPQQSSRLKRCHVAILMFSVSKIEKLKTQL